MKLDFKLDLNQSLDQILATGLYTQFWEANQAQILKSFHRHTGLRFQQRRITVRTIDGSISRAGNYHSSMKLGSADRAAHTIGTNLLHELAHRLVIGNGIEPSETSKSAVSRANYHMHRHTKIDQYDDAYDNWL